MRLSRIIMALTVGLAVVAVPTAAGAAQPQPTPSATTDPPQPPPYPPTAASLTVNRPTIYLGETVVLTGTNFGPNETVDINVTVTPQAAPAVAPARRSDGSTVAMAPVAYQASAPLHFTAYTNGQGRFTKSYKPSVTGLLTFTATGRESGRTASTELRVLHKKQPLPVTGDSLGTPMKLGGGLVGAGAIMLLLTLAWRRRQRFGGAAH
ncbi:hypothetical protein [Micromonospora foliorum]|uniref:hypothetical protein n=1 Tax=Micromonospora foliorum TaxID=2911210 RepID=UPI001EE9A1DA|nr:hypothetical protein [Micromonospora foliorum]MCG5439191.1 hypothetical protein [Micromonospora foliorum]